MTDIAVINTAPPFGTQNGQESLDLVMAGGAFGQHITVYFVDDGVFQLVKDQDPSQIESKNYSKSFAALTFYDIEDLYVCKESLKQRNLTLQDLCIAVEPLDKARMQEKFREHAHLVKF